VRRAALILLAAKIHPDDIPAEAPDVLAFLADALR